MSVPSGYALRAVTPADLPFLRELNRGVRRDEFPGAALEPLLDMQFDAQWRHYQAQYPHAEQWLILVDETPVGRVWVDWSAQSLHLIDLSVLAAYRRRGIGTALVESLQAQAAARQLPMTLSVRRDNPAARLYARLGFTEHAADEIYRHLTWAVSS